MKKYITLTIVALFIMSACSKKEEVPVDQKEKTETAITNTVSGAEIMMNNNAVRAIEAMPSGSPIESYSPSGITGKGILSNIIKGHALFFKKNVVKSPIDSIQGTWEYSESSGWQHTSYSPSGQIVLIWHFVDDSGRVRTAKVVFSGFVWYNDTLLIKFNADEYIDNVKVATYNYELTVQNNLCVRLQLSLEIINVAKATFDMQAAQGHSINEEKFYGTVHVTGNNLVYGYSYTVDISFNENGSWTLNIVMNDDGENWQFYLSVSAPSVDGRQSVSGYIKNNGIEMAKIEGIMIDNDFTEVYIVYTDGTRVSIATYLSGLNTGN